MTEVLKALLAALGPVPAADDDLACRLAYVRCNLVAGILQAHLEHEPYLPEATVAAVTVQALEEVAAGSQDQHALELLADRLEGQ